MLAFIWKKFNVGIFCAWYCQVPRSLILISKAFKLSHKAHTDFSGANYASKFSKEAKIIRLGVRALCFWRVNEYAKLIFLEKATNLHPQLKREFMISHTCGESDKVGASAQHTDSRIKFTLT